MSVRLKAAIRLSRRSSNQILDPGVGGQAQHFPGPLERQIVSHQVFLRPLWSPKASEGARFGVGPGIFMPSHIKMGLLCRLLFILTAVASVSAFLSPPCTAGRIPGRTLATMKIQKQPNHPPVRKSPVAPEVKIRDLGGAWDQSTGGRSKTWFEEEEMKRREKVFPWKAHSLWLCMTWFSAELLICKMKHTTPPAPPTVSSTPRRGCPRHCPKHSKAFLRIISAPKPVPVDVAPFTIDPLFLTIDLLTVALHRRCLRW